MVIDANIFLEVLLEQEKSDDCQQFLEQVQKGKISATVSTFTIDGIALIMERHGQTAAKIKKFIKSLLAYKGLKIYLPLMGDRIKAVEHMKSGLDFEDALTVQTALSAGARQIVSLDRHFDKLKFIDRIQPPPAVQEE